MASRAKESEKGGDAQGRTLHTHTTRGFVVSTTKLEVVLVDVVGTEHFERKYLSSHGSTGFKCGFRVFVDWTLVVVFEEVLLEA